MAEDRPLLLNDSIKDSIERPLLLNQSIKDSLKVTIQPIREQEEQQEEQEQPQEQGKKDRKVATRDLSHLASVVEQEGQHAQKGQPMLDSILTQADDAAIKGRRRYRVMQTCGVVCSLIAIVFIFALPPFLQNTIISQSIDQVVMTHENEGQWAHFPGDTETVIIRNFTFHRLMNEDDFLLRHQKPKFQEIADFKIQELEDFLDIEYSEDGSKVRVKDWLRFGEWSESRDLDTVVNILNMGNLGYWATFKAARPTLILQQGLALLFTNMEQSIVSVLIGTGINSQFLPNKTSAVNALLLPAGVEAQNIDFLWTDLSYGLNSPQNLGEWAQAAEESFDNPSKTYQFSSKANSLKNYFVLSDSQLQSLMKKIYSYVTNLKHILIENHYCADITPSECTSRYLAIGQMTEGWVTAKPPPVSTITPNDTICDNNVTCMGYFPELYAFEKNVFWGGKQENSTITFTRAQLGAWFDYNTSAIPGLDYNTAEDCLLHIGNLDQLWEWGMDYDNDRDQFGLDKIQFRLKLEVLSQAKVVWEWLKYMAHKFVLQEQKNDRLGVANLFTQGIYQEFARLQDTLQPFLLQKMIKKELVECHVFFQNSFDQPEGSALVKSVCKHYPAINTDEFASFIVSTCEEKYGPAWQELRGLGVDLLSIEYHCENNGGRNLGSLLHQAKVELNSLYNCSSTPKAYCSNFELALKQWASSAVTLAPPADIEAEFKVASSFHEWDSSVKAFQYGFFLSKFTAEERTGFPNFQTDQLYTHFTFESWFSAPVVLKGIINGDFGDQFIRYVKWLPVSVTLNGFTTNRTVREILFGYEDQFLAKVKNAYPPFGGDPSAPSIINLNELNLTESEATGTLSFLTGKADFRDVYQYHQIDDHPYFVTNKSWFTGNETVWAWKSTWAEEDYFYGTSAKIFAPNQFEANNLSLLIPQVQRYGSNFFSNESSLTQRYDYDVYISYLSAYIGEVIPSNDKYYQTMQNVFNVTSIYGMPLYITKNHFINCTERLSQVEIYNEDLSIHYQDVSFWDETFTMVDPYTGVAFQSKIYLQNNYYHQSDELYSYPIDVLLPIFAICRGGNLTETKFHELFDPLVFGLTVKSAVVYIGIVMLIASIAMLAVSTYFMGKIKTIDKNERNHSQLGISLQQVRERQQKGSIALQSET